MGAAGVLSHVAADGAGLLTGRVGDVVEAVAGDRFAQLEVDQAGLDHGAQAVEIDLEHAVHLHQRDEDAAGHRYRSSGEACAATSRRIGPVSYTHLTLPT